MYSVSYVMFMHNNKFNNLNLILICDLFLLFVAKNNIFYKYLDHNTYYFNNLLTVYLHGTYFNGDYVK